MYDQYLKQLERELRIRNYSPKTVKSYTAAMDGYFKFFMNRGQDFEKFWGAEEELVKDFLLYKKEQNCSSKTLNVYLSAIKFFYKEILKIPHQLDIKFAKKNRKLPIVLSRCEILDIIRTLQNLKHRLIISLAYGAGLRVSEVTNLKISDLDFNQKMIYIRQAKGNKDRITILPEALIEDLREFIDGRGDNAGRGNDAGRELLFLSQRGGKLSTRTLQKVFHSGLRKAGIVKPASFHSLRHSFATHLIENNVGIRYVQELLGHQNIRTTQLYTKVTAASLAAIKSPL